MSDNISLGEKIKAFRKRAGLSQLQLETQIGASPGSISRIESNQINPTKETLSKLILVLNLKSHEVSILYNMNQEDFVNIIKLSKKFMNSLKLEDVLQNSVNEIAYELNLLGAVLDIKIGDRVHAQTFTQTWFTALATKAMPKAFNKLSVAINDAKDNYMVKTILDQRPRLTSHLEDIGVPFVSLQVAKMIEKVSTVKSGIIFPIISPEGQSLAAIYYGKNYKDDFRAEYNILEAFSEQLGVAIDNANKYEALKLQLQQFKNATTTL